MYLLFDANITAGYYLPRCLRSIKARTRVRLLVDAIRGGHLQHKILIPNFCIAETFGVFSKHAFGTWNRHLRAVGTIDKRVYNSVKRQFSEDIHNGALFNQYELSRYHILNTDLVSPVDHYFQITRKKSRQHRPAGALDHLIIAMGIQLVHLHGRENVAILTTDDRLARLVDKCRSGIPANTIRKLKLDGALELTGRRFGPAVFPQCADLTDATVAELRTVLGEWPPPEGAVPRYYRWDRV